MKLFIFGVLISVISGHLSASDLDAERRGWMVGAGLGSTNLSINPKNQPYLQSNTETVRLLTVFSGYKFTDWFSIEFDISNSEKFKDINTNLDASIFGSSFTPKFTYIFNQNTAVYFKAGLQYIAYKQSVNSFYDYEITWNSIEPTIGTGVQYSFNSGVKARIDYKYAKLNLERSENSIYGFNLYDEEIDLTFSAITLSVHYQF